MKAYIFLAVIFVTIFTSWASVMMGAPKVNKDYPNQCYVESVKEGYTVGEHTVKGKCQKVNCHKDFSYEIENCGLFVAPEGYRNEIDNNKPYPACCINLIEN